ncbi:MAG: GntR family transcriptional regulator [Haliea sp.]
MSARDFRSHDEESAYEAIMDAIVTQELAPNQKVSEHIFSDRFSISRSTARTLIERLISKQFLVSNSPRVTVVTPLRALEVRQNFTLRKILLPPLWTKAASKVDHKKLCKLHQEIKQLHPIDSDDTALQLLKKNKEFNMNICEKTGFPVAVEWASQLEDTAMRIYWLYIKLNRQSPYLPEHQGMLIEQLRAYDPARIQSAVHDIITQAEDNVLDSLFSSQQFNSHELRN